jgi:hypothetical protein
VRDHFIGAIKRAKGAAGFDVGKTFRKPGIDHAPLLRGVFVVCGGKL